MDLYDCLEVLPKLFVELIFYLSVLDLVGLPIFSPHTLPNLSKDLRDFALVELWMLTSDAVSFLLHEDEEGRQLLLVRDFSLLELLLSLSVI